MNFTLDLRMLPLQHAIEHMDERAVIALLQSGADPNQPDPELGNFRPLHLAIDVECEDSCRRYDAGDKEAYPQATITKLLLAAGANPDLADGSGQTARAVASERMHTEALRLFDGDT